MTQDHPTPASADRRRFLLGGARALGAAAIAGTAGGTAAAPAEGKESKIEKSAVTVGFIPLTDCAPIAVAKEKGFFARHGLDVTLTREASWANVRDKLAVGAMDAGHMLGAMPIAATAGIDGIGRPMVAAISLGLNGNAITLADVLWRRMAEIDPAGAAQRPLTARALKAVIEADRLDGRQPLTFATVFPVSAHTYFLRYWLAEAGIDPDKDVRIITVPPPQMVAALESSHADGYCVGAPWNQRAVSLGLGRVAITSYELWNNAPDKVFGATAEWVERHPGTHRALLMALIEASEWADRLENRSELIAMLASPSYVGVPIEVVGMSLSGGIQYALDEAPRPLADYHRFHASAANFPWRSHALWYLAQMVRWRQLPPDADLAAIARQAFRPDLYREAAAALGQPYPTVDFKPEGIHATPWTLTQASQPIAMGADLFFDGARFDPAILDPTRLDPTS